MSLQDHHSILDGLWLSARTLGVKGNIRAMTPFCGLLVRESEAVKESLIPICQRQLWGAHCVQNIEPYGSVGAKRKAQLLVLRSFEFTGAARSVAQSLVKQYRRQTNTPTHRSKLPGHHPFPRLLAVSGLLGWVMGWSSMKMWGLRGRRKMRGDAEEQEKMEQGGQ